MKPPAFLNAYVGSRNEVAQPSYEFNSITKELMISRMCLFARGSRKDTSYLVGSNGDRFTILLLLLSYSINNLILN